MGSQFLGKCFLGMVDEEEEEVAGQVWEGRRCQSQASVGEMQANSPGGQAACRETVGEARGPQRSAASAKLEARGLTLLCTPTQVTCLHFSARLVTHTPLLPAPLRLVTASVAPDHIGRSLPRILKASGFISLRLEAIISHSDILGIEPFFFELAPERQRLQPLIDAGKSPPR